MEKLTFSNTDGSWGLNNYDLKKVPSELYGTICKLRDYEKTGLSPEEVGKLVERNNPQEVVENDCCPICNTYGKDENGVAGEFCTCCGQRLLWVGEQSVCGYDGDE